MRGASVNITYQPRILGSAKLHFIDKPAGIDTWQSVQLAAPMSDEGGEVLWNEAAVCETIPVRDPVAQAIFADLPVAAQRAASYAAWGKSLSAHLYQNHRLQLYACDALKLTSEAGESEGDFRARLAQVARERRDAEALKLREKYAPKLASLQGQLQRARERAERERGQLSQQKMQTAISVGATILGALLGRKAVSASSVGRATTAARSATRIGRESQDVARAEESAEQIEQRIKDLDKECEAAVAALESRLDVLTVELRTVQVAPRKSDIAVGRIQLLWVPWRTGADGFPQAAS